MVYGYVCLKGVSVSSTPQVKSYSLHAEKSVARCALCMAALYICIAGTLNGTETLQAFHCTEACLYIQQHHGATTSGTIVGTYI